MSIRQSLRTLATLLEQGELAGAVMRGQLIVSDGRSKTYTYRDVLRNIRCRFDANTKTWSCPVTEDLWDAVRRGQKKRKRVNDQSDSLVDAVMAQVPRLMLAKKQRRVLDPTYERRSYEYGQHLLALSRSGAYCCGTDGAPNWPEPPMPK